MVSAAFDRAIDGAAMAPLSSEDRAYLAAIGRLAWEKLGCPGGDYDAWRHARLGQVVERPGLTLCRKGDYGFILADFLQILGHADHAQRWRARAATEPRRVALAKLKMEMAAVLDVIARPDSYVAAIAKARFKTANIEELAANQLWNLVYDIRRAAGRRRRSAQTAVAARQPARVADPCNWRWRQRDRIRAAVAEAAK